MLFFTIAFLLHSHFTHAFLVFPLYWAFFFCLKFSLSLSHTNPVSACHTRSLIMVKKSLYYCSNFSVNSDVLTENEGEKTILVTDMSHQNP